MIVSFLPCLTACISFRIILLRAVDTATVVQVSGVSVAV